MVASILADVVIAITVIAIYIAGAGVCWGILKRGDKPGVMVGALFWPATLALIALFLLACALFKTGKTVWRVAVKVFRSGESLGEDLNDRLDKAVSQLIK